MKNFDEVRFEQAVQHAISYAQFLAAKTCIKGESPADILKAALQRIEQAHELARQTAK